MDPSSPTLCATTCAGYATRPPSGRDDEAGGVLMAPELSLQVGDLSKTVAAAFALEVFAERGFDVDAPANAQLRELHSDFVLGGSNDDAAGWAEDVTLGQLCEHTALGAYSVPGMRPASSRAHAAAPAARLKPMLVDRPPGIEFKYGDLGYLVLEMILELILRQPVRYAIKPFLRKLGLQGYTFYSASNDQVDGYADDGGRVEPHGGLVYPPLATGGRCPAPSHLVDGGAVDDLGARAGLGVFVLDCGPNKVMAHQAATEGFRGIYVVCFDGPAAASGPSGFVVLANGDEQASFLLADVCQSMLRKLDWDGLDLSKLENPPTRRMPSHTPKARRPPSACLFSAFAPASAA
ncbi:beta-lactamase [Aureococcus anophagefferens]|nr:beta-lactamase [Aureococcus anophagefferens]